MQVLDLERKESEITTLQQTAAKYEQEISSVKQLLRTTELAHAEATAAWKHSKSDVKDEIFKKKACGDKLHAATRTVEELQAKISTLEDEFNREQASTCTGTLVQLQGDMESKEAEIITLKQTANN